MVAVADGESGGEHPAMQGSCESSAVQFPCRHCSKVHWFHCLRQGNKTKKKFPLQLCASLSAVLTPGQTMLLLRSPFQLWSNFCSCCKRILKMATPFLKHQWGFLVCNQGLPYPSIASLSHPKQRWLEAIYPNKFQLFQTNSVISKSNSCLGHSFIKFSNSIWCNYQILIYWCTMDISHSC